MRRGAETGCLPALDMSANIGFIETVAIREVWPREDADFTPWLQAHIGELDKVLGLGLAHPQREVGAGDFRIDLVAETDVGDVAIENQFGRSDHRHLGQLVTYVSDRDVQRAIWIVEEGRPEHIKAVETLNSRGAAQVWMVSVRAVRIGGSPPAPLFTVIAAPDADAVIDDGLTSGARARRAFMAALFQQAREERIDSPFRDLKPSAAGLQDARAAVPGLVYRVAVNRRESRVVLTNAPHRWTGALAVLAANREEIDKEFAAAGLPGALEWSERLPAGRWVIRYTVVVHYREQVDREKMLELNQAAAAMKRVFDPRIGKLDPRLEGDAESASGAADGN